MWGKIFVVFVVDQAATKISTHKNLYYTYVTLHVVHTSAGAAPKAWPNLYCACSAAFTVASIKSAGVTKVKEVALYRWFRPIDGVLDPKGPLSSTVPPSVLTEVKKAQEHSKKRGSYVFFTPEEKARVAK